MAMKRASAKHPGQRKTLGTDVGKDQERVLANQNRRKINPEK